MEASPRMLDVVRSLSRAPVRAIALAVTAALFLVSCGAPSAKNPKRNAPPADGPTSLGALTNISDLSSGFKHGCAVVNTGVKCWGMNTVGQLGDGGSADRTYP